MFYEFLAIRRQTPFIILFMRFLKIFFSTILIFVLLGIGLFYYKYQLRISLKFQGGYFFDSFGQKIYE